MSIDSIGQWNLHEKMKKINRNRNHFVIFYWLRFVCGCTFDRVFMSVCACPLCAYFFLFLFPFEMIEHSTELNAGGENLKIIQQNWNIIYIYLLQTCVCTLWSNEISRMDRPMRMHSVPIFFILRLYYYVEVVVIVVDDFFRAVFLLLFLPLFAGLKKKTAKTTTS